MSLTDVLSWAVSHVSTFFGLLNTYMIIPGVSIMSFSVAVILLIVIIGSILMRV